MLFIQQPAETEAVGQVSGFQLAAVTQLSW